MGVNDARVWELVRHRGGRTVVLGLGWWTAALCSVALVDVPPSNLVAGVVVFGATVFGATCAVTAPFRVDRTVLAWVGTRLLVAAAALGGVAVAMRALLYPRPPVAVAYTQTPAEVPAILAGSVGSFLVLVAVGYGARLAVRRGWSALGRVRSIRRVVFARRTDR
jgi:hypothetical protein